MGDRVYTTPEEIGKRKYEVSGFLNYLFWLDEGLNVTTDQIVELYQRWVRRGEDPWIVCDEIELPKHEKW